ncbi:MAG TPA: helix-turn-helix domain-containing protein [Clostridium sp.]
MPIKKSLKELIEINNIEDGMTEKQISILSAAIELFSEKGYEATATSEIAKKANVAEGTIFRYYKTKKDLLFAIPTTLSKVSLFEIFLDDFNEILNADYEHFETFLRKIVLNRKKFASETAPILKVIIQEIPFHPELRIKILSTVVLPSINKLICLIDKFKKQGEIIDIPSTSIVNLIATSIFGYLFLHYVALPELKHDEEDLDYLIQYIINGICKNNTVINNIV